MGTALASALRHSAFTVLGPLGREDTVGDADVVLLCVPDSQVSLAASRIPAGPLVAHCSGALTLAPLGTRDAFSMHPLLSVTKETTTFTGAGCAVSASSPRARTACLELVHALGMRSFDVPDEMRGLYHAAASVAAGYVVAVAALAERLVEQAGVERDYLVPLVRSATENWARVGPAALTGPIARGDEATVAQHREAIALYSPESLPMWDALTAATRDLARRNSAST